MSLSHLANRLCKPANDVLPDDEPQVVYNPEFDLVDIFFEGVIVTAHNTPNGVVLIMEWILDHSLMRYTITLDEREYYDLHARLYEISRNRWLDIVCAEA